MKSYPKYVRDDHKELGIQATAQMAEELRILKVLGPRKVLVEDRRFTTGEKIAWIIGILVGVSLTLMVDAGGADWVLGWFK